MWTRSSGCALTLWRAFIEPMTLHALAYNLANFLRTLASPAGRGRSVVADQPAGEGGEDRGQGDRPRPLRDLPDGGGGGAARAVQPHPLPDRAAAAARPGPMLTLEGDNGGPPGGRGLPGARPRGAAVRLECPRSCPRLAARASTPCLLSLAGRNFLPSSSRGRYPGSETGTAPSIWEMPVNRPSLSRRARSTVRRQSLSASCSPPVDSHPPKQTILSS